MTPKFKKYFTPHEARRTLPLVKKIVKDILDYTFQIRTIAESVKGDPGENPEIAAMLTELTSFMNELEEIGCFYKDWSFSIGLVDFPSVINGEEVFLCWRSDEADILYYHSIEEGYSGRKLIPVEYLMESI